MLDFIFNGSFELFTKDDGDEKSHDVRCSCSTRHNAIARSTKVVD